MEKPALTISELLRQDRRYKLEAYQFVFDALSYAQNVMNMGSEQPSEPLGEQPVTASEASEGDEPERHLTGQELCEAIRVFALEQYGYMAKCVLNSWGVHRTGDFGEIVFNLIRINLMRKTEHDRREDFDDVFDFETDLRQNFRIKLAE